MLRPPDRYPALELGKNFKEVQKADLPASFPVMAVDSKFYVLRGP